MGNFLEAGGLCRGMGEGAGNMHDSTVGPTGSRVLPHFLLYLPKPAKSEGRETFVCGRHWKIEFLNSYLASYMSKDYGGFCQPTQRLKAGEERERQS